MLKASWVGVKKAFFVILYSSVGYVVASWILPTSSISFVILLALIEEWGRSKPKGTASPYGSYIWCGVLVGLFESSVIYGGNPAILITLGTIHISYGVMMEATKRTVGGRRGALAGIALATVLHSLYNVVLVDSTLVLLLKVSLTISVAVLLWRMETRGAPDVRSEAPRMDVASAHQR